MRRTWKGVAPIILVAMSGIAAGAAAQDPPAPPSTPPLMAEPAPAAPPLAQPAPPPPPAPYRRCGTGPRASVSIGACSLSVVGGQAPRLPVRIERNLAARPAALLLIWSERDDSGGILRRIRHPEFATASTEAGTVFSVPIPIVYCAPNARRFSVELELADGSNIGVIGQFAFRCPQ